MVKSEYIAMRLASLCGLNVAPVKLVKAANKEVLLIERFYREKIGKHWIRKSLVSALTLFVLDDMMARYASYEDFAEIVRHRFNEPKITLKELYGRLVFNILCGNTDDHACNHAAFWDGEMLTHTPTYDICPQVRSGGEASQAMLILENHNLSQLKVCLDAAHNFLLNKSEALNIINRFTEAIENKWDKICEEADLSAMDKNKFWKR